MKLSKKLFYKDGFTLVEIIVVLFILAILSAIAIPSMLGYVSETRNQASLSNARSFYLAVQNVATYEYGTNHAYSPEAGQLEVTYEAITNTKPRPDQAEDHNRIRKIYDYMTVDSISEKFEAIAIVDKGKVTVIRYKDLEKQKIFEWKSSNKSWEELVDIKPNDPWAGDILPDSYPNREIFWNGYAP